MKVRAHTENLSDFNHPPKILPFLVLVKTLVKKKLSIFIHFLHIDQSVLLPGRVLRFMSLIFSLGDGVFSDSLIRFVLLCLIQSYSGLGSN